MPPAGKLKSTIHTYKPYSTLTPEVQNQELVVYQSTGNAYWEGAVTIHGQSAGTQVQGEGYVELTGYSR
ncbi:MAG TPA: hypothetical protein DCL75_00735 [Ktedonobacter sp.]|nr:hypothetical protein [Ktedonobacter sp.]